MQRRTWSSELLHPDPERGPWRIDLRWAEVGGRAECVGVSLSSVDDRPVTNTAIRGIRWAEVIDRDARDRVKRAEETLGRQNWWRTTLAYAAADQERPAARRAKAREMAASLERGTAAQAAEDARRSLDLYQGRPRTPAFLARVAEVYATAWEEHLNPTDEVRRAFDTSRSSAGRWVVEARRQGYLTKTDPNKRRAGGRLTAKARRALERAEEEER